jgi:uncharacterized protein YuzE
MRFDVDLEHGIAYLRLFSPHGGPDEMTAYTVAVAHPLRPLKGELIFKFGAHGRLNTVVFMHARRQLSGDLTAAGPPIRLTREPGREAAYVRFGEPAERAVACTVEVPLPVGEPELFIDVSAEGHILGIEFLGPTRQLRREVLALATGISD